MTPRPDPPRPSKDPPPTSTTSRDAYGVWSSIGFKGGSEPGVLGMAWYLATDDGASSVVTGSVWNADVALDEIDSVLLFGAIRDLPG